MKFKFRAFFKEVLWSNSSSRGPGHVSLLACSIIALTVVIERILFWVREDMCRNHLLWTMCLSSANRRLGIGAGKGERIQGLCDSHFSSTAFFTGSFP